MPNLHSETGFSAHLKTSPAQLETRKILKASLPCESGHKSGSDETLCQSSRAYYGHVRVTWSWFSEDYLALTPRYRQPESGECCVLLSELASTV